MGKSGASGKRGGSKGADVVRGAGPFRKKRIAVTAIVAVVALAIAVPLAASAVSGGLAVPFASASTATVSFDTGDGGSEVDSQTVASGGHATKPATSPTRSGYVFAGWFESSDGGATLSGMPWDFSYSPVSGDLKLYAKWLAESAAKSKVEAGSYFMATAALDAATLSSLADGTAAQSTADANNYRSASDIAADMAVLHGTADANNQGEDKSTVTSRWTTYMDSDTGGSSYSHDGWTSSTVHLYTKWNGEIVDADHSSGSDENAWVELRVVEVGAHLNTAGDDSSADGSAVTFIAVHSLPTAKVMNGTDESTATTSGGWERSEMRTDTMQDYVLANLDEDFKSALKAVKKESVNTPDPSSDSTVTTTDDAVWLMSYKELTGTTQDYAGDEGEQYSWFSGKVTAPTGSNSAIAGLCYTRPGSEPSAMNETNAWLRSPYLKRSGFFLLVISNGYPGFDWISYCAFGVCPALAM